MRRPSLPSSAQQPWIWATTPRGRAAHSSWARIAPAARSRIGHHLTSCMHLRVGRPRSG